MSAPKQIQKTVRLPAIANGAPKPVASHRISIHPPGLQLLSCSHTHEQPVSHSEESRQRVERDVASWALWVVVWRGELRSSRVEAALGDHVGR